MRRRVVKSLAALVLAAGVLEAACWTIRTFALPPKWWKVEATSRLESGFSGTIDYADVVEGRGARLGQMSVNSFGFRGPELSLAQPDQSYLRVYCLGSSTTFGWGASDDTKTFPAQLQVALKAKLQQHLVQVVNAGVPGNGSDDELRILTEDLPRLKPQVVIIATGWPDWSRYLTSGEKRVKERDLLAPLKKSSTFRLAEYVRDQVTPRPKPPGEEELFRREGLKQYRTVVLDKLSGNLEKMIAACRANNAIPIVLGLASPLRSAPQTLGPLARLQARNRLFALPHASFDDLHRGVIDVDAALMKVCRQTQTQFVEHQHLPANPELYFDGVHMTDDGYRAFAEALVEPVLQAAKMP